MGHDKVASQVVVAGEVAGEVVVVGQDKVASQVEVVVVVVEVKKQNSWKKVQQHLAQ